MNEISTQHSDLEAVNERLAKTFYSNGRYNPVFLAVTGVGLIAIFLLTHFGVLGDRAPQLFFIGSVTLLFALAQVLLLRLAQRNKGIAAYLFNSAVVGIFALVLTTLWEGILPITILIAVGAPVMLLRYGLPRRYFPLLFALLAAVIAGITYVNANPVIPRLQNNTSAAIASIVFLCATGLLLLTITYISQNRRFKSIQGLLLTSFIIIVTIPIVLTAILSGIGAYTNNQSQTFNTLQAITTLKENQIANLLADFQNDTRALLGDVAFSYNALASLAPGEIDLVPLNNFKRQMRLRMVAVLGAEEESYNEMMVLSPRGDVIVSTLPAREGTSFQNQPFFRQGLEGFYAGFVQEDTFGTDNLIIATPIFDKTEQTARGVLVLRSNAAPIKRIMESTPGFPEAETYLVDTHFRALTQTRSPAGIIESKAALEAIRAKITDGRALYSNYEDQQVLGYYEWFQPLQLAVITEIPLRFVVNNSLRGLAGSALLALFIAVIAVAAVAVSSRTISNPIKTLVQTTEAFAAGKLSTRAAVDREDEVGVLAKAYNQMATQLQEIIGKLEQRVTDRTHDLESQTLRLRVAAEIARDAASARDLHELLSRAAELMADRFKFYHIGIFLLDNNKEYAVLVASPTEAGRQMIENDHKLRVGEVGIVGRVAATGEARITLNTGADMVFFNNPYLPNTHSEMALPLKVENSVIGVLDVQSDQPQAFNDDDVAIMQVMADQLATAIERTRLLQELEKSLNELRSAYGQFTRDNWKNLSATTATGKLGYRYDNIRLEPITEVPDLAEDALSTRAMINSNGSHPPADHEHKVAIPIKLRGQTIGVVSVKLKEGYDHTTISILEAAAERLASSMESARLYEEARLRADREQSISRLTSAISSSTEYEQILQTTVREIGSILGDTEVAIQILEEPAAQRAEQREQ